MAKNTLFLNIRLVISLLIGLYSSRLILKILGVDDYGLYVLVGGSVSLLSIFSSAITSTSQRFLTYSLGKNDQNELQNTFSSIVNVLSVFALVILILGSILCSWFLKSYLNIDDSKIEIANFVLICSLFIFSLNIIAVPYTALVTAHEKMNFYAVMGLFDSFGKLIIIFSLKYINIEYLCSYSLLLVLLAVLNRIIFGIYCRLHFPESKYRFKFDKNIIKQVFGFSLWMGIGSGCGVLKDQGGNILLNMFFGVSLNAAMGIANQIKGIVFQFGNSIGMAISPRITKSYASGDISQAIDLTFFMAKCQGIVMSIIAMPILGFTSQLLNFWLDVVPDYSSIFLRLIIIVCILNSLNMAFGPLFLAIGQIRNYQIFSSFLTVSYIPVSYFLLLVNNNATLCLWVNVILEAILLYTNYYCLKKLIDFPIGLFFKSVVIPIFFVDFVTFLFVYFLNYYFVIDMLWNVLFGAGFVVLLVMILSYYIILNRIERASIVSFIKSKLNK